MRFTEFDIDRFGREELGEKWDKYPPYFTKIVTLIFNRVYEENEKELSKNKKKEIDE